MSFSLTAMPASRKADLRRRLQLAEVEEAVSSQTQYPVALEGSTPRSSWERQSETDRAVVLLLDEWEHANAADAVQIETKGRS